MSKTRFVAFILALMAVASAGFAQEHQGAGRLSGKVVDEQGKGIEGVVVTALFPAVLGTKLQVATDKGGNWAIDGVAEGNWEFVFEKDGFHAGKGSTDVDESGRSSSLKTTLKKQFDPNQFIQQEGKRAEALMAQKDYAGARAAYEAIIAKVPEVSTQMQPFLGRAYYMEGKHDQAAEHLRLGLAKEPGNVPARLLLVDILLEKGTIEEAEQVAAGLDDTKLPDHSLYVNFGIALLKKQKNTEAVGYFDKAITRFPNAGESYYYRANALVALVNAEKDPKNAERIKRIGQIKTDLTKFIELAPNSPDAESAKKLLAEVEKLITQ